MSIRYIKKSQIPAPVRSAGGFKSAIRALPEWPEIEKILNKKTPPAEVIELKIESPLPMLKNPLSSFAHVLRKEVKNRRLPYTIHVRGRKGDLKNACVYLVSIANPAV